jgi:transposase
MKKHSTAKKQATGKRSEKQIRAMAAKQRLTVGLDLGDRHSRYCILDEAGEKVSEGKVGTTKTELTALFGKMAPCRIAIETGTHSPWVSRHLAAMKHEVIVANSRKVKLITQSVKKNDRIDAEQLARLARVDPKLLSPIIHRGEEAQADLAVIRARMTLVDVRTELINSARGLTKSAGERLKKCDSDHVTVALAEGLPAKTRESIEVLLRLVEAANKEIEACDEKIKAIEKRMPEVKVLQQISGVGPLISLTFVLTLEDPGRFEHSRDVGPYLGLTRKQRDSGASAPELGISKAGDELLRRLLVQGAHCVLRRNAPECDLKEWGERKAGNSKRGKKKVVVAVARKLGVLLHRLWATGEVYDPHYNRKAAEAGKSKGKKAA